MALITACRVGVGIVFSLNLATTLAGERIPLKGAYAAIDKSTTLEVSKTHTIISISNEGLGYVLDAPADATPMQHAAGPCAGAVEIKDGKALGSGYCVRVNPSGGKFVVRWEVLPDVSKGLTCKWEITGVDGNAAGWKGAGTCGPFVTTTPGHYINPFVGWLEKP